MHSLAVEKMGGRIDELESSIADLMSKAGIEEEAVNKAVDNQ